MKTIKIRQASYKQDHAAICKIAKQSKYTSAYSNMIFSGVDCYEASRIWVAVQGEEIVGFYCFRDRKRNPATVLYFAGVEKGLRSKGIGTLLLAHLHNRAASYVGVVELKVKKDNPAERLYRRLGYTTVGEAFEGSAYVLRRTEPQSTKRPPSD